VQGYFWDGLIHWFRATLVREVPSTRPLEPFEVVDNPQKVVDAIFKYYEHRAFGLSAEGQEILLRL